MRTASPYLALALILGVGAVAWGLIQPALRAEGGSSDPHVSEKKGITVSNEGEEKAEKIDPGVVEEEKVLDYVEVGPTVTLIQSLPYLPPIGWAFNPFPQANPWEHVDIHNKPPDAIQKRVVPPTSLNDTVNRVRIEGMFENASVPDWPLRCEGNLKPPPGGGGGGGKEEWYWAAKVASQIKMYVAYARYGAERADDQAVQVPDGWTVTITLADETDGGTTIKTKQVLATKLPKKIECTKEGQAPLIVDFVYSDDEGAWDKFIQAWKQDYHIILYSGHANSGQYFDIGPNVSKTEDGEHKGEPKNGYVVLKETVAQTPVALYVGLACYPEIPYMMLDSACVRIKNKYPNVNAIGHRKTGEQARGNIEIADIIKAVLAGGLEVLPNLTAEDIGIDGDVTVAERDARRALFTQNGASAIWHNLDKRDGYESAWRENWHAYTERQLIEGAQGQPQQDGEFDDVQEIAKGAETEAADTVVVSTGNNTYLETVKEGDLDVYDNPENPKKILAGENKIADTSTTGAIGLLTFDARQFWLRFKEVSEGSDLAWYDLTALWLALEYDAMRDKTTFQWLIRQARE